MKKCIRSAPHIILDCFHLCAKNYQSWWKFHKVMTKTILLGFLRHGVDSSICYWMEQISKQTIINYQLVFFHI